MRILFPYMARFRTSSYSRYHALLTALAEQGHEIFVVEPPARKSVELNWLEGDSGTHPHIHVIEATMPRYWYHRMPFDKLWAKGLYSLLVEDTVRSLVRSEKIDFMILYNIPLRRLLKNRECAAVFDICDDLPAMLASELPAPGVRQMARLQLAAMAEEVDAVTVSSPLLRQLVSREVDGVIPNGAHFPASIGPPGPREGPIIYVGAFEYFVDFDLAFRVARLLPERRFVFVGAGRRREELMRRAQEIENVEVLPAVPHKRLFSLMRSYSTGIVPFHSTEVGRGASPLKVFEYLASGLPVVSTPIVDVEEANREAGAQLVRMAENAEAFAQAIEESQMFGLDERGWRQLAKRRSWSRLAARFLGSLPFGTEEVVRVVP